MSRLPLIFVYAYDISDEKVRRRVSRLLERSAVRVQESVFESYMTIAEANRLFDRLARLVMPGDSLRMYSLDSASRERSRAFGGAPIQETGDFWLL